MCEVSKLKEVSKRAKLRIRVYYNKFFEQSQTKKKKKKKRVEHKIKEKSWYSLFLCITHRTHYYIIYYNWQMEVAFQRFGIGPMVRSLFLLIMLTSLSLSDNIDVDRHLSPLVYSVEVDDDRIVVIIFARNDTQIVKILILYLYCEF